MKSNKLKLLNELNVSVSCVYFLDITPLSACTKQSTPKRSEYHMYNMVRNGSFTDGFRGWTIQGDLHETEGMNNIRGLFVQIPVSSSISQFIPVKGMFSYAFQFNINSITRGMFRIRVKEWGANSEGTTSSGHVYEFDHHSSQQHTLTTGPYTNQLEIVIENTSHSPLPIQSIELTPSQHMFSETSDQHPSELLHERYSNQQMNAFPVEPPSVLHTYFDLSAINGLHASQKVEQSRNLFTQLARYIPTEPLQHVLRWMNPKGAIQVVPMDDDSSDTLVSFYGPEQHIIIKIQHIRDLKTSDFIENILYGLGLAVDVYAGNRASDHPEFQQLIQQEKERYREATSYVFTGDYHDVFAQVFTSLYSPYEETRSKILHAVPHTAHYIQRLFTSLTPFVSHHSQELNTSGNLTTKPYMHGNHSPYNNLRVGPEKPEEKPEELYDKYDKEIFQHYGYDLEKISNRQEREIVAKHIVDERFKEWDKSMVHSYKTILKPLISDHNAVETMTDLNQILEQSNGNPSFPENSDGEKKLNAMDTALRLPSALLKKQTTIYVKADLFKYTTSFIGGAQYVGNVHDYMMGTLTLPSNIDTKSRFIKIELPPNTEVGVIQNSENMFIDRQQGLRFKSLHQTNINGKFVWIADATLIPAKDVQKELIETKANYQSTMNLNFSSVIHSAEIDPIVKLSEKTTYINVSEVNGLYAQLLLQQDMDINQGNLVENVLGHVPVNAMADTISKMDTSGGIFQLTDQNPQFWGNPITSGQFGYFDINQGMLKVYYSPTSSLATNTFFMRIQFAHAMDQLTLRYTASGPNDQNIDRLSQSESFVSIFNLDKDQFKPFSSSQVTKTPEEYFAAVFASMYSPDPKERERVSIEARNAVDFITAKMEVANKVLSNRSHVSEWEDFAKYIHIAVTENDRVEYLLANNLLESEVAQINDILKNNGGDTSVLKPEYQETIRNLQTRFDQCPPNPHTVVLNKENVLEDMDKNYTEQEGVEPEDTGKTDSDGELENNIVKTNTNPIAEGMRELNNKIVVAASKAAIALASSQANTFILAKNTVMNAIKQTDNTLTMQILDKSEAINKANKKVAKFNSTLLIRKDLIETTELQTADNIATAVDNMKIIRKSLAEKTLPYPVIKNLFESLPKNVIKITNERSDNRTMPYPFKATYSETEEKIIFQRFRKSQFVDFSKRDFTNDILYAIGVPLFKSDAFQKIAKEYSYNFEEIFKKNNVNIESLQLLAEKKDPIDDRFKDNIPEQFAFILGYLYSTDPKSRKRVSELYKDVCSAISDIITIMSKNLSYFFNI